MIRKLSVIALIGGLALTVACGKKEDPKVVAPSANGTPAQAPGTSAPNVPAEVKPTASTTKLAEVKLVYNLSIQEESSGVSGSQNCFQLVNGQVKALGISSYYINVAKGACPTGTGALASADSYVLKGIVYKEEGDHYVMITNGQKIGEISMGKLLGVFPYPNAVTKFCSGDYEMQCTIGFDGNGAIDTFNPSF